MYKRNIEFIILISLVVLLLLISCTPTSESCSFTANAPLTVYRLPDSASDVFGTLPAGDTYDILARTTEGWVGFDPGVAQAGNIGLAHHRWVLINITLSNSCLDAVEIVTLPDVIADMEASGQ